MDAAIDLPDEFSKPPSLATIPAVAVPAAYRLCRMAERSRWQRAGPAARSRGGLARARLPRDALSVFVADAQDGRAPARLSYRAQVPVNPASVMKLVTTYAALDQLGPAYAWNTPVYVDGSVRAGSLKGNVHLRGRAIPRW